MFKKKIVKKVDVTEFHWGFDLFAGTFILKPLAGMSQEGGRKEHLEIILPFLPLSIKSQAHLKKEKNALHVDFPLNLGKDPRTTSVNF